MFVFFAKDAKHLVRQRWDDAPRDSRRQSHQSQPDPRRHDGLVSIARQLGPWCSILDIGVGPRPDRSGLGGGPPEIEVLVIDAQPADAGFGCGSHDLLLVSGFTAPGYTGVKCADRKA